MGYYHDTFRFEPYKNRLVSKHECPACGDKHSFKRFVYSDTLEPVDEKLCGRCDHENTCKYLLTPYEYFQRWPERRRDNPENRLRGTVVEPKKPISFIPRERVQSLWGEGAWSVPNNLRTFCTSIFGVGPCHKAFTKYSVGTSRHWRMLGGYATVFPQIDYDGKLRQVKVMLYNPQDGHRVKDGTLCERWSEQRKAYVPDSEGAKVWFAGKSLCEEREPNLRQVLFGEHLLATGDQLDIGILESEKSALIADMAWQRDDTIWLATGGKNGCKWTEYETVKHLLGRRVTLYPDLGGYEKWCEYAEKLGSLGINANVCRLLEGRPDGEKARGLDLADYIIDMYERMINET